MKPLTELPIVDLDAMIRADDADEYDLGEVATELERRANSDTSDAAEATRRPPWTLMNDVPPLPP